MSKMAQIIQEVREDIQPFVEAAKQFNHGWLPNDGFQGAPSNLRVKHLRKMGDHLQRVQMMADRIAELEQALDRVTDRPLSGELGGCMWCAKSAPGTGPHGYADETPESHEPDCPWIVGRQVLDNDVPVLDKVRKFAEGGVCQVTAEGKQAFLNDILNLIGRDLTVYSGT